MSDTQKIINDGLWNNNPGLVQILGLCPLLAVSATFVDSLGLGLATILVLTGANLTISLIRNWVPSELRIPVFVMVIAAFVTVVEQLMNAYMHDLYTVLGIFIPLIVTNCVVMARAEAFAAKNVPHKALLDGLMMGIGFALVLIALGSLREILGQGTLFAHVDRIFGSAFDGFVITLIPGSHSFLLAVLPPGAFLALGLLIALKNQIDISRKTRRQVSKTAPAVEPATTPQA